MMASEVKAIDISNVPELLKIVEEVRTSGEPRLLRRNGEDLAILRPARKRAPRRTKKMSDHEAFLSSAGGWKGLIDADKFIADIYERRRHSPRTPVKL